MYIKVNELKRADVLTEDGKKLSKIKDILYDPKEKRVIAFVTNKKGLLSEAKVILFSDVKKISKQAVLVDSEKAEKKASQAGEEVKKLTENSKIELQQKKVVGENAVEYGKDSDIFLDTQTGEVAGFELSMKKDQQKDKKTMKIEEIQSVGKDAIVVKPSFENQNPTEKTSIQSSPQQKSSTPDTKVLKDALGKYVSKNIIAPNDIIIAARGQIVTNELLQTAYSYGLLKKVLEHVSEAPLE
jgi:uncharacterized protein YrrD